MQSSIWVRSNIEEIVLTVINLCCFDEGESRVERAADYLRSEYGGQQKSFQQIIEELIDETEFLESDLRSAVKGLEKAGSIKISRIPEKTSKGRARAGIDYNDIIKFTV